MCKIYLKSKKEESLKRFHPWIFSGAINYIDGKPEEGDVVEVYTAQKEFIAKGHYQDNSITVRVLTFKDEPIDVNFFKDRIKKAYEVRKALGIVDENNNNTYRLIHGEGDNLSGLIVDIYDDTAVIQAHTPGMHRNRTIIADAIDEALENKIVSIYYKSDNTLPFNEELEHKNGFLKGEKKGSYIAKEYGLLFNVDFLKGQKTGFFIDQRENRALLEKYSKGRSVLNMFCYTGGFSFYAMRGGAKMVHSVDSSAKAIALTNQNVELNFPNDKRHEGYAIDAFKFLDQMKDEYDLIILDPPAFAKHKSSLRNALQGYRKLNARAFEKIKPGGILFTFSCSQAVNKDNFRTAIFSAAALAKRKVRILHQLTQPADHPINIYHPEGEYLKGLVVYVE